MPQVEVLFVKCRHFIHRARGQSAACKRYCVDCARHYNPFHSNPNLLIMKLPTNRSSSRPSHPASCTTSELLYDGNTCNPARRHQIP
ncbi:hypothetical protein BDR07DRAFT_357796 [Suillus spraguei]|nr:hypothetical protein BDR07DRAFT_357796 [Suillus spraguei]